MLPRDLEAIEEFPGKGLAGIATSSADLSQDTQLKAISRELVSTAGEQAETSRKYVLKIKAFYLLLSSRKTC